MTEQYSKTKFMLRNKFQISHCFHGFYFTISKDTNKNARLKSEASRPELPVGTTCENFVREISST